MKEPRIYPVERIVSSISGAGELDSHIKVMKVDHHLTPSAKLNPSELKT